METKKEAYILYEYNTFDNDFKYIKEYYNIKQLKDFYNYCNETIKDYNRIVGY